MIKTKFDTGEKVWYITNSTDNYSTCCIHDGEVEIIQAVKKIYTGGGITIDEEYKMRCWPEIIKGRHVFKIKDEAILYHQNNYEIK